MKQSSQLVERKVSSQRVFDGKLLQVYFDEVRLPDYSTSGREWIKHPGACAVVPIFENGDIMLVRQFRYSMAQIFYEVPAGKIDPGETPDDAAKRELLEEAGIVSNQVEYIGHFYPAIGYSDEIIHIYAAQQLSITNQQPDEDEFVESEQFSFEEAMRMIGSGEINDGKTIVCLQRVWNWLNQSLSSGQVE